MINAQPGRLGLANGDSPASCEPCFAALYDIDRCSVTVCASGIHGNQAVTDMFVACDVRVAGTVQSDTCGTVQFRRRALNGSDRSDVTVRSGRVDRNATWEIVVHHVYVPTCIQTELIRLSQLGAGAANGPHRSDIPRRTRGRRKVADGNSRPDSSTTRRGCQ